MKTFLENLKKELEKRHFTKEDIEEILEDHQEMIEEAKNDGLSDDDLIEKFGEPSKLAEDLSGSKSSNEVTEEVNTDDYKLLQSFPVLENNVDVIISLTSDDVECVAHDEETFEVFYKKVKNINDYKLNFDGKVFSLEEKKKIGLFGFKVGSGQFIVKVPKELNPNNLSIKIVSGEVALVQVNAKDVSLRAVSGNLVVRQGQYASLDMSIVSGDAKVNNVDISKDASINSVSGDITLSEVTAKNFFVKTVSGDCKGREFYPENVRLKSISGDMKITNSDQSRIVNIISKKTLSGEIRIN
uniref:DUF4097 domain-containing protein n=1 Tax=Firmicutes bacterium enrichment culture clone fosmid MGS-M1 TaxID=1549348 RepID=A0A0B5KU83_9FIRM|nr:hypothetical protein [Firmicutes bacterium enrichment culture clone fosmid MGS-M1]